MNYPFTPMFADNMDGLASCGMTLFGAGLAVVLALITMRLAESHATRRASRKFVLFPLAICFAIFVIPIWFWFANTHGGYPDRRLEDYAIWSISVVAFGPTGLSVWLSRRKPPGE